MDYIFTISFFFLQQKITEEYWPQLKEIIPRFFEGIEIKPSLVHGDLWSGNSAQCNSKPG